MGILELRKPDPGKRRAPSVAEKLAAVERALAELEKQAPELALLEAEGVSGAASKVAALEAKISAARAERHKLRSAHRLALELDRKADVAARAKIRQSQLAAFTVHMRDRDTAMAAICQAAAAMAPAYREYVTSTLKMVGVVPIGTTLPMLGIGPEGLYGPALGDAGRLIAAELFRLAVRDENGNRAILPFSAAATNELRDKPQAIPPAIEMLREADAIILSEIKGQIDRIDEADMSSATNLQEAS
jgi:hypothetical protein